MADQNRVDVGRSRGRHAAIDNLPVVGAKTDQPVREDS